MRPAVLVHSFVRPPWPWLFVAAGAGLLLSAATAGPAHHFGHCAASPAPLTPGAGWAGILPAGCEFDAPGRLMANWAIMLLAMMPPLLAVPLVHVWRSSLPGRRARALGHFVFAYGAAWMAAGPPLIALALLLERFAGTGDLAVFLLLALLWSASPWQRVALNRAHRLRRIGLFGRAADRDCLAFGAIHGGWCIASCWLWMLTALAVSSWPLAAMVATGAVMLVERLTAPAEPRWRRPAFLALLDRPRAAARNG